MFTHAKISPTVFCLRSAEIHLFNKGPKESLTKLLYYFLSFQYFCIPLALRSSHYYRSYHRELILFQNPRDLFNQCRIITPACCWLAKMSVPRLKKHGIGNPPISSFLDMTRYIACQNIALNFKQGCRGLPRMYKSFS